MCSLLFNQDKMEKNWKISYYNVILPQLSDMF